MPSTLLMADFKKEVELDVSKNPIYRTSPKYVLAALLQLECNMHRILFTMFSIQESIAKLNWDTMTMCFPICAAPYTRIDNGHYYRALDSQIGSCSSCLGVSLQ